MTQQGAKQKAFRNITSTAFDYNGDFNAFCLTEVTDQGTLNGNILKFLKEDMGVTSGTTSELMALYAISLGYNSWSEMGPLVTFSDMEQLLFTRTLPSGSTIFDERPGLGTARAAQPFRAYDFDGTNDHININQTLDDLGLRDGNLMGACSFSAWINMDDTTRFRIVCSEQTSLLFTTTSTSNIGMFFYSDNNASNRIGGQSATTFSTSTWYHVCGTYDGSNSAGGMTLYVDNVSVTVNDDSQGSYTNVVNRNLLMGQATVGGTFNANGRMFDVRIYDRELTADEVTHIYTFGESGTDPGIANNQLQYKCDDTNTTTAYDSSGNGRHGTKTDITASSFHYTGSDDIYSYQNEVGFTDSPTNGLVPRDESDPTNDVLGTDLEFTGRAPINALFVNSACGKFDGTNDYVQLPFPINPNESLEVSARFRTTGTSERLVDGSDASSDGFILTIDSSGNLSTRVNGSVLDSTGTYNDGVDYRAIAQWDGSILRLIVQDASGTELENKTVAAATTFNVTTNAVVGRQSFSNQFPWSGVLYDVNITLDGVLTGQYPIAENAGDVIHDVSGNGNHASAEEITEATFWGSTQDHYHYNVLHGFNESYKYNGTDNYHDTGFSTPDSSGSIEVWATVGSDTTGYFTGILGTSNGRLTVGVSNGRVQATIGDNTSIIGTTATAEGDIHKFSMTYGGNSCSVFLDDVLEGHETYDSNPSTGNNMFIGARNNAGAWNQGTDATIHRVIYKDGEGNVLYDTTVDGWGTANNSPSKLYLPALNTKNPLIPSMGQTNDAGIWHNGAETEIDFTGGVTVPGSSAWETSWTFHDTRTNPRYNRELTSNGIVVRADRFIAFASALGSGPGKNATDYVATKEI